MNKQKVYDYVTNTPHNTNPNILSSLLNEPTSWNDLANKPFGTEGSNILVAEGIPDEHGGYTVDALFEEGKEYTYLIDGVKVTGTGYLDDTDNQIWVVLYTGTGDNAGSATRNRISLNRAYFDFSKYHKIEIPNGMVVHKLDGNYLPDPFWIEKQKTLLVEGVPEYRYLDFPTVQLEVPRNEPYIVAIDGAEYTGTFGYDEPDHVFYLENPVTGNIVAILYSQCILLFEEYFDVTIQHKIELVEQAYHTHHDFMVIFNSHFDEEWSADAKLVAGSFMTAKERILKGLPVTVFVRSTHVDTPQNAQEIFNVVDNMRYINENGMELFATDGFVVFPDGTVGVK